MPRTAERLDRTSTVRHDDLKKGASFRVPQWNRRLSDSLLVAFYAAYSQGDFEVAQQLLYMVETVLVRQPIVLASRIRRDREALVAAYELLWMAVHPESNQQDPSLPVLGAFGPLVQTSSAQQTQGDG